MRMQPVNNERGGRGCISISQHLRDADGGGGGGGGGWD